jgi:hypothetical protein
VNYIEQQSYTIKSLLFFLAFQLMLFPLMIVTYSLGLIPIYRVGTVQSIALTSFVNHWLYGYLGPFSVYGWYLIGILLYAFIGLAIGWGIRNRFSKLSEWKKLVASLVIFEILLYFVILGGQELGLWDINAGW